MIQMIQLTLKTVTLPLSLGIPSGIALATMVFLLENILDFSFSSAMLVGVICIVVIKCLTGIAPLQYKQSLLQTTLYILVAATFGFLSYSTFNRFS